MYNWNNSSSVPWYSYKSQIKSVTIGDSVISIGSYAFAYCTSLAKATVYSHNVAFGSNVFRYTASNFELHGYAGSTAEGYARANGHYFVAIVEEEVTYTAAIGEAKYTTLAVAIKSADRGATIDLLADAEAVTASKAVTINKNGFNGEVTVDGTAYGMAETANAIVVYPLLGNKAGKTLLLKDMIQIKYMAAAVNYTDKGFTDADILANGKILVWTGDGVNNEATYLFDDYVSEVIGFTYDATNKAYAGSTEGIPARLMGDVQKFRFCITDADGVVWYSPVQEYSARIYAENMYGKYAFKVNNGIASAIGKSAILKGAIEINIMLQMQTAYKNADLTLIYWTEADYNKATKLTEANATGTVKFDKSGSYPGALINGIPARLLGDTVFFYVKAKLNGVVSYTQLETYSIHQYCVNTIAKDSNSTAVKNLAKAILVYSNKAEAALGK